MDHKLAPMSDCTIARMAHSDVKAVLAERPSLGRLLWRDALIDAAAFRAWMLMQGAAEALERMAHLFCELIRATMAGMTKDNSLPQPLTQADLSDILSISVVHANRTLQDLRNRGYLEFDQKVVTMYRWEELRALAQFDPRLRTY